MIDHPTVQVSGNDNANETEAASQGDETRAKVVIMLPEGVPSDVRDTVLKRLADEFGGFTLTESRGGWVSPDGELITERVTQVEAVRMHDEAKSAESVAKSTAEWVRKETNEHSVMWEVRQVNAGLEGPDNE